MSSDHLPEPRLTLIYRLEATLAPPLDLGNVAQGLRRIVAQTGGTFTGPELNGKLLPGASADWQIVLSDGTALGSSLPLSSGPVNVPPASTPSAPRPRSKPQLLDWTG